MDVSTASSCENNEINDQFVEIKFWIGNAHRRLHEYSTDCHRFESIKCLELCMLGINKKNKLYIQTNRTKPREKLEVVYIRSPI